MARFYAQFAALVFVAVGVLGLLLGDASGSGSSGRAGGNLGGLTLHLTWWRDGLDLVLAAVFAFIGFVASRHLGRLTIIVVGAVLVALAVGGFVVGDDQAATKGFLGMHFPVAINLFDLAAGLLGVLAGLGTVEAPPPPVIRR